MKLRAAVLILAIACYRGSGQEICSGPHLFSCDDNTCISKARTCDGMNDCPNGEDESASRAECDSQRPVCATRNVDAARSNGYPCRRRCNPSSPTSCSAPQKRCICDDECGYSCLNPNAACSPDVPDVKFAVGREVIRFDGAWRIDVLPGSPYKYGDTIKYRCREGMALIGLLPRCSAAKQWSTTRARCVDDSCSTRPCWNGGTCVNRVEGYLCRCARGFSGTLCQNTERVDVPRREPPRERRRGHHQQMAGRNQRRPQRPSYRPRRIRQCRGQPCRNRGICHVSAIGEEECTCLPRFTGFRCEQEIICSSPHYPDRGFIAEDKREWKRGEIATIQCLEGFALFGNDTFQCIGMNQWSQGKTKCVRNICLLDYLLLPEALAVEGYDSNQLYSHTFNIDDVVTIQCNEGLVPFINGNPFVTRLLRCVYGGKWSPNELSITCEPPAEVTCEYPELPEMMVLNAFSGVTQFQRGNVAIASCQESHALVGSEAITCLDDGVWSELPTCVNILTERPVEVFCDYPELPEALILDLSPEVTQFQVGTVTSASCQESHELVGSETVTCLAEAIWSEVPMCVAMPTEPSPVEGACEYPELREALALRLFPKATQFQVGTVATASCRENYKLVGHETVTCLGEGLWSELPICIEILAETGCILNRESLQEDVLISPRFEQENYQTGDVLGLYCRSENRFVYSSSLETFANSTTCSEKQAWEPAIDTFRCVQACKRPFTPSDGVILRFQGDIFPPNHTLYAKCPPLYRNEASNHIRCLEDGTWTEMAPCVPVGCWVISDSLNETVTIVGHSKETLDHVEFPIGHELGIACVDEKTTLENGLSPSITCIGMNMWSNDYRTYRCDFETCSNRCLSREGPCACDFACVTRRDCCADFKDYCKK